MRFHSRSQRPNPVSPRHHPMRFSPRHAANAALVLLCSLAGCTTPDAPVRLYSLIAPVDAASKREAAGPAAGIPITLSPIRLPAQVDQPQILVQLDDGSLVALEQQRWASPLPAELREAMLERLTVRYGAVETRTNADLKAQPTDLRVVFRRFESRPGREALIEGTWTMTRGGVAGGGDPGRTLSCDWLITEPASGGVPSLAQAHRRALSRLTDQIGQALTAPGLKTCPTIGPPAADAANGDGIGQD